MSPNLSPDAKLVTFQYGNEIKLRGLVLTLFFRCSQPVLEQHLRSTLESIGADANPAADDVWILHAADSDGEADLRIAMATDRHDPALDPQIDHRFDVDGSVLDDCAALVIAPEHVGQYGDPVEILHAQAALALTLSNAQAMAVHWGGASVLMGAGYFRRMAAIWLEGGAFPALGLAALVRQDNGVVRSVGLDLLVGQDVAVLPSDNMAPPDQARLAMRMMDFLVREGPVQADQTVEVDGFGAINVQIDANKGLLNLSR